MPTRMWALPRVGWPQGAHLRILPQGVRVRVAEIPARVGFICEYGGKVMPERPERKLPGPPWSTDFPADAAANGLTLLLELVQATRRCADALERIADEQYAQNRT